MQTINVTRYVSVGAIFSILISALAACSQNSGGGFLPSSARFSGALARAYPPAAPPACKGQKTAKGYAYVTETLSTKGGVLCVPAFGRFGGTVPYGPANPPVKIKLTTSTTNYNNKLPQLGNGPPLLYTQFAFGGNSKLGTKAQGDITFTGVKIAPGKAYTLFGQFIVNGKRMNSKPCYAIASKDKYGGVFDAGKPLADESITQGTLIGELDPGKQTDTKCT